MNRNKERDDYWTESVHTGFDFADDSWPLKSEQVKFSEVKKITNTDDFDLLHHDGLNEAVKEEFKASSDSMSFSHNFFQNESEGFPSTSKSCDSLSLQVKVDNAPIKVTPSQAVRSMIFGMECSFEQFKALDQKVELLQSAVDSHDGNVIIAVVLYMRKTLKKSLFHAEIMKFPAAVSSYLLYLEDDSEFDELADVLLLLGRTEKAAMLKYQAALGVKDRITKIKRLENCMGTHFHPDSVDSLLATAVSEHHLTLAIQSYFENFHMTDAKHNESPIKIFEELTGKDAITDCSALELVLFASFCNLPEADKYSSHTLKKNYNLNSKQYTWTMVRSLAVRKKWKEIDDMFKVKTLLGGSKTKCCIGFPNLLGVLSKYAAPMEMMVKYLNCVEDSELQLSLAKKYKCHSVVIQIFKLAKDRQSLLQYMPTLDPQSVDYYNVKEILNSTEVKWKN